MGKGQMSVLQKVFLHTPARSPAVVEEYERQHREEGEQLDFKAIAWKKGESLEAAKDVAAFANHLGGDIIIGINDKGDRADGWNPIPNADIPVTIRNIRDWLIYHIRPVLRQNLVTIDIVDFLRPSATLYRYEGITILAVLLFQSNTQRAMQFGF